MLKQKIITLKSTYLNDCSISHTVDLSSKWLYWMEATLKINGKLDPQLEVFMLKNLLAKSNQVTTDWTFRSMN